MMVNNCNRSIHHDDAPCLILHIIIVSFPFNNCKIIVEETNCRDNSTCHRSKWK